MYLFRMHLVLIITLGYVFLGEVNGESTLKLVNLLYRHGDRTPIVIFPTDPNQADKWPEGPGWLTTIGMQQHYALGGWLRRRYVDTGFLSRDYKNTEIKVYSSDVSRCLMSAYSNLAGMFPPGPDRQFNQSLNWQPIPVHTRPTYEDNTLSLRESCPRYMQLINESFYSPEIQEEERQNKAFYEWLGNHTGLDHENLNNIWEIGDTLFCEKSHNFTFAPWVNDTVYEKLRSLLGYQWSYLFKTKEMERLKGGPLLGEIIENMRNKTKMDRPTPLKMYMYSGHDTTIVAMLRTLQIFDRLTPPYAAMIIMELHQNTSGDYYVKLFYKNSTTDSDILQYLTIPNCSHECPLQRFIDLTKPMVPIDWLKECAVKTVPTPKATSETKSQYTMQPTTNNNKNSSGIVCLSCYDVTHLRYCDHIQRCQQDEICYVSKATNTDGRIRYRSGCVQQQQCVRATLAPQTAGGQCFQCCANDFCNHAGCGDPGFQSSSGRGPLCFDCSSTGRKEGCDTIKLCASNQACKIEEYIWGDNERLFKLGCEDKLTCSLGGSMHMKKRSAPVCSSCCDNDFCNRNCTASQPFHIIG